jgi:hypothetical protein
MTVQASLRKLRASARTQRGVATLVITLMLLVILTIIILSSSNVALFEQKTATNENRARLAEQAAEYAINLSGEYLKANRDRLISNKIGADGVGGWLAPSGASMHWARCADVSSMPTDHPCMAEPVPGRRAELYFYTTDGTINGATDMFATATSTTAAAGLLPTASRLAQAGGAFNTATTVNALLCRLDTSLVTPACRLTPVAGNRIAVTLFATASLPGENASASVKESWGTYSTFTPSSAVPLVASGFVQGLGNAQIVAAPNAGGYGIPATMWSPNNICIDTNDGACTGVASISTCQRGEFLGSVPEAELKTTCATVNNACGCPAISAAGTDFLSGHSGGDRRESIDILDVDGAHGTLPDITFYPGAGMDDPNDPTDDSLFEWIFGVDYEASEASTNGATLQNCTPTANCAINALEGDLAAQFITCAQLNSLAGAATGLYYITDSSAGTECSLPTRVGSVDSPAIVVMNDAARLNNTVFYGMLFVRSDSNNAFVHGAGSSTIVGSLVTEGSIDMAGSFTLIYDDTSVSNTPNDLPKSAKFGRLPGSWLDSRSGF